MTIRHLKIFLAVYQKASITDAAASLNMTQPTVTRAIQELEDHYSKQLFERIHRRLYVTEAGKQLYRQGDHVVSAMEQMDKNMSDWDEIGILRVGAGTTLGCILLPQVLAEFQKTHPQVKLHGIVTDRTKLQEKLMHNEIDFALLEGLPEDSALNTVPIGKDRMILILPLGHPLCEKEQIVIQDLAEYPVVISSAGTASRGFLEHLYSLHGMNLSPTLESDSIPAVLEAVSAGIGVSLLPEKMVSLSGLRRSLVERELTYEVLTRENYLIWHESRYLARFFQEFIELVRTCGASVLD